MEAEATFERAQLGCKDKLVALQLAKGLLHHIRWQLLSIVALEEVELASVCCELDAVEGTRQRLVREGPVSNAE
jgi:hypothetical protein